MLRFLAKLKAESDPTERLKMVVERAVNDHAHWTGSTLYLSEFALGIASDVRDLLLEYSQYPPNDLHRRIVNGLISRAYLMEARYDHRALVDFLVQWIEGKADAVHAELSQS